jgi:hypothetical protein
MSDVKYPMEEVCQYLTDVIGSNIRIISMYSVMRNYKCILLEGKIDIRNLQQYCETHFQNLLNTKFSDIIDFLINPAFDEEELSPLFEGWNEVCAAEPKEFDISFTEMHRYLFDSLSIKNLYVNFEKLKTKIQSYRSSPHGGLNVVYKHIRNFYIVMTEAYCNLDNSIYRKICRYLIDPYVRDLSVFLTKSKDNLLSHIKYDPEKYPGFLIKIKTPNWMDDKKKTTIKIFPSGKINIDGANSRKEAEYIYYWLNWVFYNNPSLIYHGNFDFNGPDSEFSSDSEDF